ncbi:DUF6527 family protein [Neobacillus niacini]|uniref:DUF6527 family protein n=1 Tax=Neobacillus niacini TaxID=86668 RepID=UPI002FFDC170
MKVSKANDGRLLFYCQGCECHHGVTDSWQFNGDFNKPTFSPSVLVRSTEMTDKGLADYEKWCDEGYPDRNGEAFENVPTICHSFVTDGKIQYLNDCTHELTGQTVELEDMD